MGAIDTRRVERRRGDFRYAMYQNWGENDKVINIKIKVKMLGIVWSIKILKENNKNKEEKRKKEKIPYSEKFCLS